LIDREAGSFVDREAGLLIDLGIGSLIDWEAGLLIVRGIGSLIDREVDVNDSFIGVLILFFLLLIVRKQSLKLFLFNLSIYTSFVILGGFKWPYFSNTIVIKLRIILLHLIIISFVISSLSRLRSIINFLVRYVILFCEKK